MKTEPHIKILDMQLLAYCACLVDKNFIFQEDGTTCPTSRAAKNGLKNQTSTQCRDWLTLYRSKFY